MRADAHYGDDGLLYDLEEGDRVEFATSEMDGIWGIGDIVRVIEDGYYVVRVTDTAGIPMRGLYDLLRDAGRFEIEGTPASRNGWTVELDGTAMTNAQSPQCKPADWDKQR